MLNCFGTNFNYHLCFFFFFFKLFVETSRLSKPRGTAQLSRFFQLAHPPHPVSTFKPDCFPSRTKPMTLSYCCWFITGPRRQPLLLGSPAGIPSAACLRRAMNAGAMPACTNTRPQSRLFTPKVKPQLRLLHLSPPITDRMKRVF